MDTFDRLWEFKHKPQTFDDLILNNDIKPILKDAMVKRPNLLIHGPAGVGKGSFVDVMIKENKLEDCTLKINASLDFNIDEVRTKIKVFAQSMNFDHNQLKLLYLNEADHSSALAAQKSLRALQEETSHVVQWVYCCNYVQSVIPEILSRCQVIYLNNPPATEIFKKCESILNIENVSYNKKSLVELVKKCYPDIRNTIITLRKNVIDGVLQERIQINSSEKIFDEIFDAFLEKDPDKIRKLLRSNSFIYSDLYFHFYNKLMDSDTSIFKSDSDAILLIAEHLYRDSVVKIQEVNFIQLFFKMLKEGLI